MGSSLYSFLCSPSIFCSFWVSGSTSFLALFFGVSGVFIFALLINNLKFFGRFVFSLTTPSNLGFMGFLAFSFLAEAFLHASRSQGNLFAWCLLRVVLAPILAQGTYYLPYFLASELSIF